MHPAIRWRAPIRRSAAVGRFQVRSGAEGGRSPRACGWPALGARRERRPADPPGELIRASSAMHPGRAASAMHPIGGPAARALQGVQHRPCTRSVDRRPAHSRIGHAPCDQVAGPRPELASSAMYPGRAASAMHPVDGPAARASQIRPRIAESATHRRIGHASQNRPRTAESATNCRIGHAPCDQVAGPRPEVRRRRPLSSPGRRRGPRSPSACGWPALGARRERRPADPPGELTRASSAMHPASAESAMHAVRGPVARALRNRPRTLRSGIAESATHPAIR